MRIFRQGRELIGAALPIFRGGLAQRCGGTERRLQGDVRKCASQLPPVRKSLACSSSYSGCDLVGFIFVSLLARSEPQVVSRERGGAGGRGNLLISLVHSLGRSSSFLSLDGSLYSALGNLRGLRLLQFGCLLYRRCTVGIGRSAAVGDHARRVRRRRPLLRLAVEPRGDRPEPGRGRRIGSGLNDDRLLPIA